LTQVPKYGTYSEKVDIVLYVKYKTIIFFFRLKFICLNIIKLLYIRGVQVVGHRKISEVCNAHNWDLFICTSLIVSVLLDYHFEGFFLEAESQKGCVSLR